MKRNITIVIVLSLTVSACCEKEGSFLGTIIKNRAAQIAATAEIESVINEESSSLNANAAAITAKNTQTALISSKPDTTENTYLAPELQTITIKPGEFTVQAEQKLPENVTKKTIETTDNKTVGLKESASQSEENLDQTITKLSNIESDNQLPGKPSIEIQTIEASTQATKDLTEVIGGSPVSQQRENITDQNVALANENIKEKNITQPDDPAAGDQPKKNTDPTYNKTQKLSELISLLNEEDNTAIEEIIEQAKSENLTSSNESDSDRNTRLLELLSKDIKKQADKTNSKISQQSLDLLNEILSN